MTFAISTLEGDHLGFIVLSGETASGDCVIKSLPASSESIVSPASQYLQSLQKLGELYWQLVGDEYHITDADGETVLIEKQGRMTGSQFVYEVIATS